MFALIPAKVYFISAIVVGVLTITASVYLKGRADGYAKAIAQQHIVTTEALQDAVKADEAARRCASDPACRLSNDGFRRD